MCFWMCFHENRRSLCGSCPSVLIWAVSSLILPRGWAQLFSVEVALALWDKMTLCARVPMSGYLSPPGLARNISLLVSQPDWWVDSVCWSWRRFHGYRHLWKLTDCTLCQLHMNKAAGWTSLPAPPHSHTCPEAGVRGGGQDRPWLYAAGHSRVSDGSKMQSIYLGHREN